MSLPIHKAIVTSGPTREWIDPVRYISNASSGKMGFAIANSLMPFVSELVYIHGGVLEKYAHLPGAKNLSVETTLELRDAVLGELTSNCILIMAAAPADFRPIMTAAQKIKKEKDGVTGISRGLLLELEENPDILVQVKHQVEAESLSNCIRIGFAAETEQLESHAKDKLARKGLAWIVGNQVGKELGFGEVESQLWLYSSEGDSHHLGPDTKENLAKGLVDFLRTRISFTSRETKSKVSR